MNQPLAETVVAQLLVLDTAPHSPIQLLVNSPGGHVESADTIHDVIRFIRSPVFIIGTGWVASVGGQVSDIEIELEQMLELRRRIGSTIAERTGRSFDEVERDTQRNRWMTAAQAVDYGIVGKIIKHVNDMTVTELPRGRGDQNSPILK